MQVKGERKEEGRGGQSPRRQLSFEKVSATPMGVPVEKSPRGVLCKPEMALLSPWKCMILA
jgi:hypothetical protein